MQVVPLSRQFFFHPLSRLCTRRRISFIFSFYHQLFTRTLDPTVRSRQRTAAGKRQILAEIGFLRDVASSSPSTSTLEHDDGGGGIRHIVAVREIFTESAIPRLLMKKEPRTLRSMLEGSAATVPAEVVK